MPITLKTHAAKTAITPQQTPSPQPSPAPSKNGNMGWMKYGKEAIATLEYEEKKATERRNTTYRFYMKPGEDRTITFLDGDVDADGVLSIPMYYEHRIKLAGRWTNVPCLSQVEEACPICEGGDTPAYVGLMTVIDHTPSTGKDGKVYQNQVRLLVAKRLTVRHLGKIAAKKGGLAGCRFDVSRSTKEVASVGDLYSFDSKQDVQAVMAKYNAKPVDYLNAIQMYDRETLVNLGYGIKPIGQEAGVDDDVDVSDAL